MQLSCPKCGSRDALVAHRRGLIEQVKSLFGIYPLRCRRCKARWRTSTWQDGAWRYARCPRCYRQELTSWDEAYYNPPLGVRFWLSLGAKRHRCAACRHNFTGFKPRKQRFERRHEDRPVTEPEPNNEVRTSPPAYKAADSD
jgi:DNA-directed RNA polymerase subunit RPC12/RpoP